MLATVENMKAVEQSLKLKGKVCAYSPDTGEIYSATSGDYWNTPKDKPLLDNNGNPMILAREVLIWETIEARDI